MPRRAIEVTLDTDERALLEGAIRATTSEQRMVFRCRIVLMSADGEQNQVIAEKLGTSANTVRKWRGRFAGQRLAGLEDSPRSGAPPLYGDEAERRILAVLDEPAPDGYACWNGPLIARRLGDVSVHQVWRVLRDHRISLERRRSWCISTDPEFAAKAADVVGLYLNPPEGALVVCMDEKPSIQALERAQGWLRLPNGRALTGYAHEYRRHGTTTLFAALEVATGQIRVAHTKRKRRREFLAFMNELVAAHPDREMHVILDNLSTHKPKNDRWLSRRPLVHFHYTPTHASWLNMVEVWFSMLWRNALRGASFTSPAQVRSQIDKYVTAHNQLATPFEWTKTEVRPVSPKHSLKDLCR